MARTSWRSRLWAVWLSFPFVVIVAHIVRTNAPHVPQPMPDPLPFRFEAPEHVMDVGPDPEAAPSESAIGDPPSDDEPTWERDHVALSVVLDASLERVTDAVVLPYERREGFSVAQGRFAMRTADELAIYVSAGGGLGSTTIDVRFHRSVDAASSTAKVTGDALLVDSNDAGPTLVRAWAGQEVRLSSFDWPSGSELVVQLIPGSGTQLGPGLGRGTFRLRVPPTAR